MENPNGPVRVATAGEALIDLVGRADGLFDPRVGGAVYNFTRALSLQGLGTAYLNPLSHDGFGRLLTQGLAQAGVALAQPEPVPQPTSLAVVAVDEQGQPAYTFYREGVADRAVDAGQLMARCRALPELEAVCTGCLALSPQDQASYLPWLRDCRARGLLVVVDANLRPAVVADLQAYRANVRAALALADVIKVSDEDLALLAPAQADPLAAARELFASGPARLVALTRGGRGAILLARDGRQWQARDHAPLRIVDTVGAGDCFLAGLVAGLLAVQPGFAGPTRELTDAQARAVLERAVASASYCVQQRGCVPPTAAQVRDWIARRSIGIGEVGV